MRVLLIVLFGACALGVADTGEERCRTGVAPFGVATGEAERHFGRGRPYDVEHILLDLQVDVAGERLSGVATHRLTPIGQDASTIIFDSVGLDIEQVVLNDTTELDFATTEDELRMFLPSPAPAGEPLTLAITYSVFRPERGMHFRTERMGYQPEEVQAWTQGEAEDARFWFPCFDAPNERATTEVIATVDEQFVALSNGEPIAAENEAGKRRFHWRLEQPHVTYLVSLVVGPFVELEDSGGGVPLFYYVLPGQEDEARLSLGETPQMMALFQDLFDVPYPYGRYSQVAVVDFIAGGMENTTISTLTERTLHDEAAHLTYSSDWLVAHELIHQWFGNLVTCRDWSHLWLNEGFATLGEFLYAESDLGEEAFRHELFAAQDAVIATDTGENRAPIVRQVYSGPGEMFGVRVYEKGGAVLHMLRAQLGDELFFRCINEYLKRFAHQSVETTDLLRTFESVTGLGMERFFHQWVYSGGFPELKVEYEWLHDQSVARVTVRQTQTVDDKTPLFHFDTTLLFHLAEGDHVEPVSITEAQHVFHVPLPSRPEYVRLDPKGDLLKKLEFSKPKEMLRAQLAKDTTLAGQYEACDALGALDEDDAVDALRRALEGANFWGVRARAAKALGGMDHPDALTALTENLDQEEAKVRRAVAEALGASDTPEAVAALKDLADDRSPYVAAEALENLAELEVESAANVLRAALKRDSHNEIVRSAALGGLAELEGADALPAILPYTEASRARMARRRAIGSVGIAGQWMEDKDMPRERLEALLEDPNPFAREWAREALVVLGDLQAVDALERAARTEKDEERAKEYREAAKRLRERDVQTEEVKDLREEVQELKDQGEEFAEKLEKLEGLLEAMGAAE